MRRSCRHGQGRDRRGRALHPAPNPIAPRRGSTWAPPTARARSSGCYRVERLAAARDGKRIKEALEQALALDPAMHDAEFGIGMYRYYADVAPAAFKFLRCSCSCCPAAIASTDCSNSNARPRKGMLVRGEAQYQIQSCTSGTSTKPSEALALVRGLQQRYPHNPLFHQIEAEIARCLLPRSRRQPEGIRAVAGARAIARRCSAPTSPRSARG